MKKVYLSLAVASAVAVSANAVEVNAFGHLGAFYQQGISGLPVTSTKDTQRAYGNLSARVGLDLGLGKNFSIGLGGWGAYPFYSISVDGVDTGKEAVPHNGDVSDAYVRYDGGRLSFALGRFDMGQFFLGQDGKNYTGVDWIYGNVQGGAINIDGGPIGLWGYWRNSQLGAGQAYGRMGYELSSFDTYQGQKRGTGELFAGGVDIRFSEKFKLSPFAQYLTSAPYTDKRDILNAGLKAQLDLGGGSLESRTIFRVLFGMDHLVQSGKSNSNLLFWIDEELRYKEIFKFGAGYMHTTSNNANNASTFINYGDRSRFYGYRGGFSGAGVGNLLPLYGSTYYVFGGLDSNRVGLDLLWAGGDYTEASAVGSLKVWESGEKMNLKLGAGYVGTRFSSKWQHSALAFLKFGF